MQIDVRRMQPEDAPAVNRLSHQLGYSLTVDQTMTQIAVILAKKDHAAWVAVEGENIIGWTHAFQPLYIESLPFVEVGGLVVDEAYRGKGVGKALVNRIKDWCMEQRVYTLRLRTQVKRLDAHQFYRALRFEEIKEQKVFQLVVEAPENDQLIQAIGDN